MPLWQRLFQATAQHDIRTAWRVNYHRPSLDGMWSTCTCSASSGYHADIHEGDDDWDSRLYRIWTNLKVQASLSSLVMLRLHCVFFFRLSVGNNALKFSNFKTPILKYLKNFCIISFIRPNILWNSPSSSFTQNVLCIQYFRFTAFLPVKECKTHMELSRALQK